MLVKQNASFDCSTQGGPLWGAMIYIRPALAFSSYVFVDIKVLLQYGGDD